MKKEKSSFKTKEKTKKIFLAVLISALLLLTIIYLYNNFLKEKNARAYFAPGGQEIVECPEVCKECKKIDTMGGSIYDDNGMNDNFASMVRDLINSVNKCVKDVEDSLKKTNPCAKKGCKPGKIIKHPLIVTIEPVDLKGKDLPPCKEGCSSNIKFSLQGTGKGSNCNAAKREAYQNVWKEIYKKIKEECGKEGCEGCEAAVVVGEVKETCEKKTATIDISGEFKCSQKGRDSPNTRVTVNQKVCIECLRNTGTGDSAA